MLIGLVIHVSIPRVAAKALASREIEDMWIKFTKKYKTSYSSSLELEQRKAIFTANLKLINRHNEEADEGLHSYKLAMNKFSDLTQAEFKARYLVSDVKAMVPSQNTVTQGLGNNTIVNTLPLSYDLRTARGDLMNPIQDQGSCGSCWAFTVAALLEYQYAKRTGKVVKFSEQYFVDCDTLDSACQSGWPTYALFFASITGLPTGASYPYKAFQNISAACDKINPVQNSGYFYYNYLENLTDTNLRNYIVNSGMPVVTVDGTMLQFYSSGILDGSDCSDLNHVVNAIGYYINSSSNSTSGNNTSASNTTASSNYWILKNQWGANWGEVSTRSHNFQLIFIRHAFYFLHSRTVTSE